MRRYLLVNRSSSRRRVRPPGQGSVRRPTPTKTMVEAQEASGKEYQSWRRPSGDMGRYFSAGGCPSRCNQSNRCRAPALHMSALRSRTRDGHRSPASARSPFRLRARRPADGRRRSTAHQRSASGLVGEDGKNVRERIIYGLRTMALAADIDVRAVARGQGAQMARSASPPRTRAGPSRSRTSATASARCCPPSPRMHSSNENLIVYQPEAHLHPLSSCASPTSSSLPSSAATVPTSRPTVSTSSCASRR